MFTALSAETSAASWLSNHRVQPPTKKSPLLPWYGASLSRVVTNWVVGRSTLCWWCSASALQVPWARLGSPHDLKAWIGWPLGSGALSGPNQALKVIEGLGLLLRSTTVFTPDQ